MKFVKKYNTVYSYILVYTMIYHVQTGMYSVIPTYTELLQSIEINTSHTGTYQDILYRDRMDTYCKSVQDTLYNSVYQNWHNKKTAGFEPRTSCILHGCSYHCTASVDAEKTL